MITKSYVWHLRWKGWLFHSYSDIEKDCHSALYHLQPHVLYIVNVLLLTLVRMLILWLTGCVIGVVVVNLYRLSVHLWSGIIITVPTQGVIIRREQPVSICKTWKCIVPRFRRWMPFGIHHCCAEGHAHSTGPCAPLSSLGSGPVHSGVQGTPCPIGPGFGESFQVFKFSWTVLLLSGWSKHRVQMWCPLFVHRAQCVSGGTLVEVIWGTHVPPYFTAGSLGQGSHEWWRLRTLSLRILPRVVQGQYSVLVTCQFLGWVHSWDLLNS